MNCFYHQDHAAVGMCKNCQRGLCATCAAEAPNGLACKDRCESQVAILNALLERSGKDVQVAKNVLGRSGTTYISLGIAMGIAAAIWNILQGQLTHVSEELPAFKYLSIPFWLMSAVMVLAGISQRKQRL